MARDPLHAGHARTPSGGEAAPRGRRHGAADPAAPGPPRDPARDADADERVLVALVAVRVAVEPVAFRVGDEGVGKFEGREAGHRRAPCTSRINHRPWWAATP